MEGTLIELAGPLGFSGSRFRQSSTKRILQHHRYKEESKMRWYGGHAECRITEITRRSHRRVAAKRP